MGFNQGFLFFSNRIEALVECLIDNLFRSNADVFSERFLVFPSREMEKWVRLRIASKMGIASGIQSFSLNQAVALFSKKFFSASKPFFIPDDFELTLKIEELLTNILHHHDFHFETLTDYLKGNEKRLLTLSRNLAILFQRYGIYGNQLCEMWEKNPQSWQEFLWQKTFSEWDYPLRILPQLKLNEKKHDISLHLFSFSHLSPLHFDFFKKISEKCKVYFYQLSPCLEFWSDFPSKRSFTRLEEDFLLDVHPLLAFTGKVGREMAKMIEDTEGLMVFENYHERDASTALSKLQSNLLLLKQDKLPEDDSIQIHVAKTELREIQNLYQFVLHQMKENGFVPQDFIVLAPDISVYEPYIRAIFDNPQITDLNALHKNAMAFGLFSLLELNHKRWSNLAILQLFEHPLFCKKMGWTKEEINVLKEWIQKAGIRWGLDAPHRDFLLKESHCQRTINEEKATWSMGIDFLLEKLAAANGSQWIDFTQAELLGECSKVLENLFLDLEELKKYKTLKEWGEYFLKLSQSYFAKSEDCESFEALMTKFFNASQLFPKRNYSFLAVHFFLKEWMASASLTLNAHSLSSVSFCSIVPMRAIPAKVLCLIGMNENAFPRKDPLRQLDLTKKQKGADFVPSKTDFDRYLFLEAILSARDILMVSYLDNDTAPSTLITELLREFSQKKIIHHPTKSHDPHYFDGSNKDLINYSKEDYELACRFKNKKEIPSFFVKKNAFQLPKGEYVLDILELNRLLRSPLKVYFEKCFGCHFQETKELDDEEAFTLSHLRKHDFQKLALKEPLDRIVHKAAREKDFPLGVFGNLAVLELEEEISEMKKNLKSLSCITAELVLHEKTSFFDESGIWRTPALHMEIEQGLKVSIVGQIEGIYEKGLISLNKWSFQNGVKLWPAYLVSQLIDLPPNYTMEGIFFVKNEEIKKPLKGEKEKLISLIKYYFLAQQNPSPLFLEWMEPFLKKDVSSLRKKSNWENVYDPILKWALVGRGEPNFFDLIDTWIESTHSLKEMYDAWF